MSSNQTYYRLSRAAHFREDVFLRFANGNGSEVQMYLAAEDFTGMLAVLNRLAKAAPIDFLAMQATPTDDSETDAIVSALAALTDRVRALEGARRATFELVGGNVHVVFQTEAERQAEELAAGTPGQADTVGDDFFSMRIGTYDGEARHDPGSVPFKDVFPTPPDISSAFSGPSTRTAHVNFTDDEGREFKLILSMPCFLKLRSAMLAVDEDGEPIDTGEADEDPSDDNESDAVVSALAALTDRVRALEERGAKPIDVEKVLDALRARSARGFKELRR